MNNRLMYGFSHLKRAIELKGKEHMKLLFQINKVMINLKLDAICLIVRKDENGLTFFNRNKRLKIDKIYRIGNPIFEEAIKKLEKSKWRDLKNGIEIHLEWFPNNKPNLITYEDSCYNKLYLSYTTGSGRFPFVYDDKVCEILNIEKRPIIRHNTLSDHEIDLLFNLTIYGGEDFKNKLSEIAFIEGNERLPKSNLIEGAVIYLSNGMAFKVVDPVFTNKITSKQFDEYDIMMQGLIPLMWKFLTTVDYTPPKDPNDRCYLNGIVSLLMRFENTFESMMYEYSWQRTNLHKHSNFPKNIQLLNGNSSWIRPVVFRYFLFNLRYVKRRATKNFTKDQMPIINKLIRSLNEDTTRD